MDDKKASSVIVGHTAVPSRILVWSRRFCTLRVKKSARKAITEIEQPSQVKLTKHKERLGS
jgi:hypothetical protein